MPIDPTVFGLVLGALLGTVAGFSARGIVSEVINRRARKRPWPISPSVAQDLYAARRVINSLALQLNEARRAPLNSDSREILVQVHQSVLVRAEIDEQDLPQLGTTLLDLESKAATVNSGAKSTEEAS